MTSDTRANEFAADTTALVLRIERRRLSAKTRGVFESAEAGAARVHVPSIVFAEILYLSERGRIDATLEDVAAFMSRYPSIVEMPMTFAVIQAAGGITDIPELHDRLIAGAARYLGVPLVTNDPVIEASGFVQTIW